jgi:hypothetical protein
MNREQYNKEKDWTRELVLADEDREGGWKGVMVGNAGNGRISEGRLNVVSRSGLGGEGYDLGARHRFSCFLGIVECEIRGHNV